MPNRVKLIPHFQN